MRNTKKRLNLCTIIPIVLYDNMENKKQILLKENLNKSGVYRITNKINSKTYIGSSNNLRNRFLIYFSVNRLLKSNMIIYKAILKYGYLNFNLEIVEYCDSNLILIREQYCIDILKPEYNILQIAGSTKGFKHNEETLEKFKNREVSKETRLNLSKAATSRILSEETKIKISMFRKGTILSDDTKKKLSKIGILRQGISVSVTNIITNDIKEYESLTLASLDLGVSRTAIRKAMQKNKILKGIYVIKKNSNVLYYPLNG